MLIWGLAPFFNIRHPALINKGAQLNSRLATLRTERKKCVLGMLKNGACPQINIVNFA